MARALLLALSALVVGVPVAAQESALRLDLNIPALRLDVYDGSSVVRSYPVAVGMPGHNTPTGQFDIDHAEWNPWWRPPEREWARGETDTPPGPNNPMGRVKLFFQPLYFIHGTPEAGSIGTPASHGCVRMRNEDVVALARLIHERVVPAVGGSQIDAILRSGRTRRVDFARGIPLTVRYDPVEVAGGEVRVFPDIYGRRAVHAESVYQALIAAGYDVAGVDHDDVRRLVERTRGVDAPVTIPVADAFGPQLVAARAGRR